MAQYFFDTSAFVKYYHREQGSHAVAAIFAEPDRVIRVSNLGVLETQSVFAMKVRMGVLDSKAANSLRARMLADISAGTFSVQALQQSHLTQAAQLIGAHGFQRQFKTLDALQMAIALDLARLGRLDRFVASDRRLLEVAALEGLPVVSV